MRSLPLIETLIGFDTTSRDSNLALIYWVRDYLVGYGVDSRLTFDESGRKANLFATIGPAGDGGIVLSGHTDVVPVDGQPWTSDPFRLTRRDGRLYGRGTCDMKSFLAIALASVPQLLAAGLKRPIHLALSYDEEVGCLGVPRLIADLLATGLRPAACIVGEPTEMQVITGHKGKLSMRCHVRGLEGHSSLPHLAVNAVEYAAELVVYLRHQMAAAQTNGPFDGRFNPPYTTIHTGVIAGGTALNIVPLDCSFDFEFRTLPGADKYALLDAVRGHAETVLLPQMRAVHPGAEIRFDEIAAFPELDTPEDADVVTLAKQVALANGTGKAPYGTEAGLFQAIGIPTVVCGPGSIEQAHKPDEFIAIDQIEKCEAMIDRLIAHLRD